MKHHEVKSLVGHGNQGQAEKNGKAKTTSKLRKSCKERKTAQQSSSSIRGTFQPKTETEWPAPNLLPVSVPHGFISSSFIRIDNAFCFFPEII